ncbi:MAG: hypothetical protein MUE73_01520 [Planctomycetes bacterium]|nr:hypothetical protein [Planctomycetota bacterium]
MHQRPDGGFARDGDPEGPADLPATGLAILAFLAQGEMPKHGEHRSVVQRGLRYLKGVQNPGGCFGPPEATVFPLAHAIATAAMVEAWRLTASPLFRRSAQEALDHITRRGDSPPPWESGTRVGPGDAVATAWLARATLHAALGRLDLPPWTIDRLRA